MTNEIQILKRYFEVKHLHVSEYYLQCCLEWIHSQFTASSENELCEKVYEQWLIVDLREMAVRSLPPNLSKQKKMIIQGHFAVQVMYFKDISKSNLLQLKNIRNMYKLTRSDVDTENEPQGKRTLYLHLTDGVEYIYAFEYETVKCLDINLSPGIKLLLVGPLTIRNGEILLKNINVKVLGGEVEDLLVCNAVENVLARELNLPENPTPGVPSAPVTNNEINNGLNLLNNVKDTVQNQSTLNQNQNINPTIQHQNHVSSFNPNPSTSRYQEFPNEDDNFADFVNDDDLIAQLADDEFEQQQNAINDVQDIGFDDEFMDFDINDHLERIEQENCGKSKIELPVSVPGEPYNYIKQLTDNKNKLINKTFRVKAQFVSVVQKLTFNSTKGWTMKLKITDGTGVLVVDFLSEILEELLGVTHEQALVLKQKYKNKVNNASDHIKQLLSECKDKLTLLNCFMGLKYFGESEIPTVIWLKPVLQKDFKNLKLRVDAVKNK